MKDIRKELLDELLENYEQPEHLGYEKGDAIGRGSGNSRNGHVGKRVLTESGSVEVLVRRDRNGSFEPRLVRKGQSRLSGFDEKVISLYARGMTRREIMGHLRELYGVAVLPA